MPDDAAVDRPPPPPDGDAPGTFGITFLAVTLLLFAGVVGVARFVAASPAEHLGERFLAALALGGTVAIPGLVTALSASRSRLRLTAAGLLVPCSVASVAGVLLPLLIPAVLLTVSYGRHTAATWRLRVHEVVLLAALVPLVAGCFLLQFRSQDPRAWAIVDGRTTVEVIERPGGPTGAHITTHEVRPTRETGTISDITTVPESTGALVLVTATGALVAGGSRPRRNRPVSRPRRAAARRPAPPIPRG